MNTNGDYSTVRDIKNMLRRAWQNDFNEKHNKRCLLCSQTIKCGKYVGVTMIKREKSAQFHYKWQRLKCVGTKKRNGVGSVSENSFLLRTFNKVNPLMNIWRKK